MSEKRQKPTVRKNGKTIEFSLGDAGPTKYEIMKGIAQHHTIYGATVWLNTPLEEYDNKTPAALMLEGKLETVAKLVEEFRDERRNT